MKPSMEQDFISIVRYQEKNKDEIELMINEISKEFQYPISSPTKNRNSIKLTEYWIASKNDKIIGTIGLIPIKDEYCILVRMFVSKPFRGVKYEVSKRLLETAMNWCKEKGVCSIYLGTMNQFKAAHRFYEKNEFKKIEKPQLPKGFLRNPIDDVFYVKDIDLLTLK